MKYSYKWLKELSGTDKSPEELAAMITMRAFEVESVEPVGFANDRVVVGEVRTLGKHPDADKLRVAEVDVCDETLTIVCGAPNVAEGQRVAVALEGAVLPGDFVIGKRSVRGVESRGMICSQKELGTGEDGEGIWVLPGTAKTGMLVEEFLGGADVLLDIKVLPDRAHDCLSHVGMAREIAALEGRELDFDFGGLSLDFETLPEGFSVAIECEKSERYIGARIRSAKVGPSPHWLETRLRTLGIRPINAVVDATNYVMLELGQPLHAFDWDKIAGEREKGITVRMAEAGERITLLDGKEHILADTDIVIADTEKPLALAGIMGGSDSGVTEATTELFIEAAHFDPVAIRRTRERLGLRTDASDRFEKGLSPALTEKAMARVLEILQHIISPEAHVAQAVVGASSAQEIDCSVAGIESLLGVGLDEEEAKQALRLLGFEVRADERGWKVDVPAWRLDIDGAADIAEEIGRLVGYDQIVPAVPYVGLAAPAYSDDRALYRALLDTLVGQGFSETYNYSFYSERDAERARLGRDGHLELANPMSPDQALLRTSLLPRLLSNVCENAKHADRCMLTEFGRTYHRLPDSGVEEARHIGGVLTAVSGEQAFFELKGRVDSALRSLGLVTDWTVAEQPQAVWHPTRTAEVFCGTGETRVSVGTVGMIHPGVRQAFGIRKPVAGFEWRLADIVRALPRERRYAPIRRFPTVSRDTAFFVPDGVTARDIVTAMRQAGGELLVTVEIFDRYRDDATGRTSLAFHLELAAPDRTLPGDEADQTLAEVIAAAERDLGLELRR